MEGRFVILREDVRSNPDAKGSDLGWVSGRDVLCTSETREAAEYVRAGLFAAYGGDIYIQDREAPVVQPRKQRYVIHFFESDGYLKKSTNDRGYIVVPDIKKAATFASRKNAQKFIDTKWARIGKSVDIWPAD